MAVRRVDQRKIGNIEAGFTCHGKNAGLGADKQGPEQAQAGGFDSSAQRTGIARMRNGAAGRIALAGGFNQLLIT